MLQQRLLQGLLVQGRKRCSGDLAVWVRAMSGPKTATPPPDAARGATADLCDVFLPDPVDVTSQRKVQIMDPIFQ